MDVLLQLKLERALERKVKNKEVVNKIIREIEDNPYINTVEEIELYAGTLLSVYLWEEKHPSTYGYNISD